MNINIERYLTPGTLKDIWSALRYIKDGRRLALVRIPALDFFAVMEKLTGTNFMPFRPVIFNNIPVDMTDNTFPELVLVADDDTNISKTAIKETELFKG